MKRGIVTPIVPSTILTVLINGVIFFEGGVKGHRHSAVGRKTIVEDKKRFYFSVVHKNRLIILWLKQI